MQTVSFKNNIIQPNLTKVCEEKGKIAATKEMN
jgi:hypothetical protein